MSAARRASGFTLLEMLVALLVFGFVMAGIAQTFRFGMAAWQAGQRGAARPDAMAALDLALIQMINQAIPGSMTGHPDGLAFITRLPAGAGLQGGLAQVAILATRGGELIMRYGPNPPGIPLGALPAMRTEPLASGITGIHATYLAQQASGAPVWTNSWSGDGLPLLVRIHLDLAGHQTWPDLVAAPTDGAGN